MEQLTWFFRLVGRWHPSGVARIGLVVAWQMAQALSRDNTEYIRQVLAR